jgi:hypothetical protein
MKKKIFILMTGLWVVLIATNLFAADGDLIVNGGKVGIGTTTPSYPLTVKSSGTSHIVGLDSNGYFLFLLGDLFNGGDGFLDLRDNSGNMDVRIAADNNSWIMNNVGIGTQNPGANLEINGAGSNTLRIRATGSPNYWDIFQNYGGGDNAFVYLYNGGVVAKVLTSGAWQQLSDTSLKENIAPLENPIEKIKMINGVSFNWINQDLGAGSQIGVLAQEVEQVLPEAVSTNEEGNKMISYASLIPLLIESIKEQQKAIDALKAELATIKK